MEPAHPNLPGIPPALKPPVTQSSWHLEECLGKKKMGIKEPLENGVRYSQSWGTTAKFWLILSIKRKRLMLWCCCSNLSIGTILLPKMGQNCKDGVSVWSGMLTHKVQNPHRSCQRSTEDYWAHQVCPHWAPNPGGWAGVHRKGLVQPSSISSHQLHTEGGPRQEKRFKTLSESFAWHKQWWQMMLWGRGDKIKPFHPLKDRNVGHHP